jgi:hypothetical protein
MLVVLDLWSEANNLDHSDIHTLHNLLKHMPIMKKSCFYSQNVHFIIFSLPGRKAV